MTTSRSIFTSRFLNFSKSLLLASAFTSVGLSTAALANEMSAEAVAQNAQVKFVHQEQEPLHHQVLSTDFVLARDVQVLPGSATLYHLHDHDSVMVALDSGDVPQEIPAEQTPGHRVISGGSIYYKGYASKHFVHKISNVGDTPFRIIEILLLKDRQGLVLDKLGDSWTSVIDNDRVRVSKVTIQPGVTLASAPFKGPHLYLATTDGAYAVGDLQMNVKRGTMLPDSSANAEVLRNIGKEPMELVVVEPK
ncbi:hypothetical protein [Burkholderia cenocepacia]|uniref:hypothetical protein n=1 Tax=Burkholderia cenocepacia TaxID=95486 RepID=UPI000761B08B|nr:hypothetical protein [Burkholderia cenocepacia]KWU19118.1 hypothetical protein AS149_12790 [Burkholderia cenocepacia]